MYYEDLDVNLLLGKTLVRAEQVGSDELHFETTDGEHFKLYHIQDCCESVYIDDINGDLQDLVGVPLTLAEESSNSDWPEDVKKEEYEPESYTWTFYRFATVKGYVNVRWYGSSNGYY